MAQKKTPITRNCFRCSVITFAMVSRSLLPSMSGSFIILGLFGLPNGHHVRTPKPNDPTVSVFHAVYTTAIHFPSGPSLQAQIHIWSPSNDVLHMNDTVALVFAKAFVPPNPDPSTIVLLEAYYIYSFPV